MSLEYNNIDVGDRIKISPSGFSNFAGNPRLWYENNILKTGTFRGNTNTVVGTIIHNRIEQWFNNEPIDEDAEAVYIESFNETRDVEPWKVVDDVKRLWVLLEVELPTWEKPSEMEKAVRLDIPNSNYTIAGTFDYLRGTTLGDYKTASSAPKKIKVSHKIQMSLYVLSARAMGTQITHWEVTYIVKTKTPKIVVLNEPIDEEFVAETKQEIKDMIIRVELVNERPELESVLFFKNRDSFLT